MVTPAIPPAVGDGDVPPGGGGQPPGAPQNSYSDKLKMNVRRSEKLNRKVLEITLETDKGVKLNIEDKDVAKLAARLGIDIKSQLEGYQTCPGYSRKILFWFREGCKIKYRLNLGHCPNGGRGVSAF